MNVLCEGNWKAHNTSESTESKLEQGHYRFRTDDIQ